MPDMLTDAIALGGRVLIAALLGILVSYRRDTDRHHLSIIHSHAYLAMAGALFIVIIGNQIERAIGLIGVATIIRYRYAIRNPKDAGTLIIALGLGMACGAGLLGMAVMGTLFVMIAVRLLDLLPSILPDSVFQSHQQTRLRVVTASPERTVARIESALAAAHVEYSLTVLEQKRREEMGLTVTVIEAQVRFNGDLDISRLTADISDDDVLTVSWREAEPAEWY